MRHHDGEPADFLHIVVIRSLANAGLSYFVPLYALVDVCFIFGAAKRCLHDQIFQTVVVKCG